MYLSFATVIPLLSLALASASRDIQHEQLVGLQDLERRAMELQIRQKAGDLGFCYGRNSICATSNALNDECDGIDMVDDRKGWYGCICKNGYVSVREACNWCDKAWGITPNDLIVEMNSEGCSSYSFTIAPIPKTVLAQQSSYNSTWTGTLISTGVIGQTATGDIDASTTSTRRSSGSASTSSSSQVLDNIFGRPTDTSTSTYSGGGTFPEPTGPAGGEPTATGSSLSGSGSGSGAMPGLDASAGLLVSIAVFAFAGMILL